MNAQRHARVSEIFLAACELHADDRRGYLDTECDGDAELRSAVESLLERDARPAAVDRPLLGNWERQQLETAGSTESGLPEQIGPYDILGRLGQGGMGVVYKAQQRNPPRSVALKMIHYAYFSPRGIRRFEFEAEVLARLKHPGIAQIFDAGTADGPHGAQPYFALELVEGVPLTEYVRNNLPDTNARLTLLIKICDAVHHAHQQGVIHRDLKPANILVEPSGQPKILDFGVARLTDQDFKVTTEQNLGQVVGTIPYMSPEQIRGSRDEVDVRSDVYALGVIGYEMLAGRLPYLLRDSNIAEAARIVHEEPVRPLGLINATCRGDVETIVAKALEKEKEQRYASASDLAADVRRYLHDEPILARPATTFYQFRKLVARHRLPFSMAALLLVSGIVFSIVVSVQAARLARERDLAQAARADAERQTRIAVAVNQFVNSDLLGAVTPDRAKGQEVTVREILEQAAQRIGTALADDPLVEASIRTTIGQVYYKLGRYADARPHVARAVQLQRESADADPKDLINAIASQGELYYLLRQHKPAADSFREAVALSRKVYGENDQRTISMMGNLAVILKWMRDYDAAEKIMRDTLAAQERLLGPEHPDVAATVNNLGVLTDELERFDEAEEFYRRALQMRRNQGGEESVEVSKCLSNLAGIYRHQNRLDDAESLFRQSLAIRQKLLGSEHTSTANTLGGLAGVLRKKGQYAESLDMFEQSRRVIAKARGADNPQIADIDAQIGACLLEIGRLKEAERVLLDSFPRVRDHHGLSSPHTLPVIVSLIDLYESMQRPEDATRYKTLRAQAEAEQQAASKVSK